MTWSPYKTTCACGHDIDTHFRDPATGAREACLGSRCDCTVYRDALAPPPPPTPVAPAPPPVLRVGARIRVTNPNYTIHGQESTVIEITSNGLYVRASFRADAGGFSPDVEYWLTLDDFEVIG